MGQMQPIVGALTGFVQGGAAMTVDVLDAAQKFVDGAVQQATGGAAAGPAQAHAWLQTLAQLAGQVDALGERAALLSVQVSTASRALQDPLLVQRGQAIVQAFDAGAQFAARLSPTSPGVRWLPERARQSLFGRAPQIEAGLAAASGLAKGIVSSLPELGSALGSAAGSIEQGAKLLKAIARVARRDLH